MAVEHEYKMSATSSVYKDVSIKIKGIGEFQVTSSQDWWPDARGDLLSPQSMLVAASASCFILTLYNAADHLHSEFSQVEVHAHGTMAENEHVWSFDKIQLDVRVTIKDESELEKINKAIGMAHKMCPIANTLSCPTELNFEIVLE